jgi:hypothetical protein
MLENISHSFSFTMACADDESGNKIMIPELDEVDTDNTVIDSDPKDDNHEHLGTMNAVPDTPTSWTYRGVPTIALFTSIVLGSKLMYHIKCTPFHG